jgi:hypothetical protein
VRPTRPFVALRPVVDRAVVLLAVEVRLRRPAVADRPLLIVRGFSDSTEERPERPVRGLVLRGTVRRSRSDSPA